MNRIEVPTWRLLAITLLCLALFGCSQNPPAHGTVFTVTPVAAQTNQAAPETWRAQVEPVLVRRFQAAGMEPFFEADAPNRLQIKVAAVAPDDVATAKSLLTQPGQLAFRLVHSESEALFAEGKSPAGFEWMAMTSPRAGNGSITEQLLVELAENPALGRGAIKQAIVVRNQFGEPEINFRLTAKAATAFTELTRENVNRRLAIIVDGKVLSAPVIRGEIPGGHAQITGAFSIAEATTLAAALEASLPIRLELVETRSF